MVINGFSAFNTDRVDNVMTLANSNVVKNRKTEKNNYKTPLLISAAGTVVLSAVPVFIHRKNINSKFASFAKQEIRHFLNSPRSDGFLDYLSDENYRKINFISEHKSRKKIKSRLERYKPKNDSEKEHNDYLILKDKLNISIFETALLKIKSDFNEIFRAKVINSIVKYNTIGFIPMFGIPALVKFTQTRKVKGNENCSDNK